MSAVLRHIEMAGAMIRSAMTDLELARMCDDGTGRTVGTGTDRVLGLAERDLDRAVAALADLAPTGSDVA